SRRQAEEYLAGTHSPHTKKEWGQKNQTPTSTRSQQTTSLAHRPRSRKPARSAPETLWPYSPASTHRRALPGKKGKKRINEGHVMRGLAGEG
ncbi:hypothetical protein NDU88_007619, partial [Pleurodeles waltl]